MGRGEGSEGFAGDARGLSPASLPLEELRARIASQVDRIAQLGAWPEWISPQSLLHRIPEGGDDEASGFDAGIACALDLIPEDKQLLSAKLHAAYTEEAVEQVRREAAYGLHPDFETTWWLAACSVCSEGGIVEEEFYEQIEAFERLAADPKARHTAAKECLAEMKSLYALREDGVPMSIADGGMQGAYLVGYELAGAYDEEADLYFIGTFHPSLGLEEFDWSDEIDEKGRPRSGGIHGSLQFVKCHDENEFERALATAHAYLSVPSSESDEREHDLGCPAVAGAPEFCTCD